MNGSSNHQGQKCFLKMSQHKRLLRTDDTVERSAAGRTYGDGIAVARRGSWGAKIAPGHGIRGNSHLVSQARLRVPGKRHTLRGGGYFKAYEIIGPGKQIEAGAGHKRRPDHQEAIQPIRGYGWIDLPADGRGIDAELNAGQTTNAGEELTEDAFAGRVLAEAGP